MPANLSLILNLFLLAGIVVTITRVIRQRRNNSPIKMDLREPSLGVLEPARSDDIIAVRRVSVTEIENDSPLKPVPASSKKPGVSGKDNQTSARTEDVSKLDPVSDPVMLFISAKKGRQFAGYELLQALLACGLRFGEGNLFHRHQGDNGQGILMCSLAAATETGQFNLSRMGAFACRGLCLFLEPSHNSSIDQERFSVMLRIAEQLAEELDAILLDEQRNPFTDQSLQHYERRLGCELESTLVE